MTAVQRTFGRPASLHDLMTKGKEFTDAAMDIKIDDVLSEARLQRSIGRAAAHLSGQILQREGDMISKRLVFAAYDNLYDLMQPVLDTYGTDGTKAIFTAPTTRDTLLNLSSHFSSYGVSNAAHKYRTEGSYFKLTDDGLEFDATSPLPQKFEINRGGCPYAKSARAPYFNRFTDHIVDTYIEARQRNMPHGWLDAASRFLIKR